MRELLIVANETLSSARLREAVLQRQAVHDSVHARLVVPQQRPRRGSVVYLETVRSAAQVRLDLALAVLEDEGIEATGQVGDYDPFLATIDAVASRRPDEIVISTFPAGTSRWLRRHLVERVADATGLPVTHVVDDVKRDEACYDTSLVIANRTADSDELREHLADMPDPGGSHRFIVVVPQRDRDGAATAVARADLDLVLSHLREAGLLVAGTIGDPDAFTATMNALQLFRVDRVIISTLPATRSGWLRADLIERVRRSTACPVEHVLTSDAVVVG
jgi:hypothetical protein